MFKRFLTAVLLFIVFNLNAQTDRKIFTLSLGYGYFNQIKNNDAGGNVWIQADYKFHKQISFAMEFENASFEIPIVYGTIGLPNRQYVIDNSFTLMCKYHLPSKSKIQIALGGGASYRLRTREYFDSITSISGSSYSREIEITDAIGVPLGIEIRYPLTKFLHIGVRIRSNLYLVQRSTYGGGLLLAIKL